MSEMSASHHGGLNSNRPEADAEPQVASLDRHGYLFGQNITHSLSPLLHQVVYDHLGLRWAQLRLDSADVRLFLDLARHPGFYGASVSMPNKVAILPHLDEMTDECRAVGACNTVFMRQRDGRRLLYGANTDVIGIRDALRHAVADPEVAYGGQPALVIGAGGTARSAVYALRRWMGVGEIYLVGRDGAEAEALARECAARGHGAGLLRVDTVEQARRLRGPGAVVGCVPDAEPRTEGEVRARRVAEALLGRGHGGVMLDMCYTPTPLTALGRLAEERGWRVVLGTEAMVWQGLEQDRYWTGREMDELPVDGVRAAIAARVAERAAP